MKPSLLPILALGLLAAAPAPATAQTVYFSVGSEIRKHTLGTPGTSLVHTSPVPVRDLALCADNTGPAQYLYFVSRRQPAEGDRISRLDINTPLGKKASVNTSAADVYTVPSADGKVGEIRMTPDCDVIFASEGGVFELDVSPMLSQSSLATTTAGSGVALHFNGDPWFSDGATLARVGSTVTKTATSPIVGLGVANGGHGSKYWNGTSTNAPLSIGAVCASFGNAIRCGPKDTDAFATPALATFTLPGLQAQHFEFLTNDEVIAATAVDPNANLGGIAKFNGVLYRINPTASQPVQEIFTAPKVSGAYPPIVGVAVGPSTSQTVVTASGTTHGVNFGPVTFNVVTPQACSLAMALRQLTWQEAADRLDIDNGNDYDFDPGLGGESFLDNVLVTESSGPGTCGVSTQSKAVVHIYQYGANTSNKAVLQCEGIDCKVITTGVFPFSLPDDWGGSGGADDFSNFMTAEVESEDNAITFLNPLTNSAIVQGGTIGQSAIDAATSHNANGGLSIRFRICGNPACSVFLPAEFPDSQTSEKTGGGLSVTRLDNAGFPLADCTVNPNGGANPESPIFRVDTDGITHIFNLSTPLGGDPAACGLTTLPSGQTALFSATVFSNSGRFNLTTILFKLRAP